MSSSRLKEQDELIQLIRSYICDPHDTSMTVEEAFEAVQILLDEHYKDSTHFLRLRRLCPSIGKLFCRMNIIEALHEYDQGVRITKRKFVPPSFKEVRQIINIAVRIFDIYMQTSTCTIQDIIIDFFSDFLSIF